MVKFGANGNIGGNPPNPKLSDSNSPILRLHSPPGRGFRCRNVCQANCLIYLPSFELCDSAHVERYKDVGTSSAIIVLTLFECPNFQKPMQSNTTAKLCRRSSSDRDFFSRNRCVETAHAALPCSSRCDSICINLRAQDFFPKDTRAESFRLGLQYEWRQSLWLVVARANARPQASTPRIERSFLVH